MPLRVIVVEDQAPAREHLTDLVRASPDVDIIAVCADGQSAIAALRAETVDVVLLDIHMPECDGFEVIEAVGIDQMPAVIFITAFDDHAVRAFDVRALDYLLKPFTAEQISRALDRARADAHQRRITSAVAALAAMAEPPNRVPPAASQPLVLRQRGQVAFVPPADVELVVGRRNDVVLYTRDGEHRYRATLNEMHRRLGETFVRVHRSALVNLAAASPVVLTADGVPRLQVGTRRVRVSKALRADVERRLRAIAR